MFYLVVHHHLVVQSGRSAWCYQIRSVVRLALRVGLTMSTYFMGGRVSGRQCRYTAGRVCRVRNGNEWWASQCRMMEGRDVCVSTYRDT